MTRRPRATELHKILRDRSLEIEDRLAVSPVQLSMPVDGKGVRIKVSVQKGFGGALPSKIEFPLDGETLEIPLEVREDFQDYRPL